MRVKYIPFKIMLVIACLFVGVAFAGNVYLIKYRSSSFKGDENDIEKGMSAYKTSKDKLFNYRVETKTGNALIININDGAARGSRKVIEIPAYLDGHKVTLIDAIDSYVMETLILPDTVESIREQVGRFSSHLKYVYCKGTHLTYVRDDVLDHFQGTVYTTKGNALYQYCIKKKKKVKLYQNPKKKKRILSNVHGFL